ncbi:glycerate kinase [Saccharopolyspora rhizosphaerae]|uniref:Glycerate kinase n=1 Tax=Saccharopolyspora rhizosphaerae TaxID=2492662 RepID=A0A426JL46_9PSEU|nr:glycerate kinase [Saccharopolyspora rhizosphaerae]RRO13795.1 glycerate kinase [Saccharopolyspora rhizosphaerae]
MLRIVVAPSGFKECLDAEQVADAIQAGVRRVIPGSVVDAVPLIDGGEGSARLLARATGGTLVPATVTGPLGDRVDTHFALLDGNTAFVEMAAAAGLSLVPADGRDPGRTTSRGVGELIRAALDAGAERLVVGCGDSGVCDGGAGTLQALGVRIGDEQEREIGPGGAELLRARSVDVTGLDPRLSEVEMTVAVNPRNVLCGPDGVARRFGPQKGASAASVELLSSAMAHWAQLLDPELAELPGAGASGGLAAGLAGVLGARLRSRFDVFLTSTDLDQRLRTADLVITAEGAIDASTALGKIPTEVARRAKQHGKPVIALCGTIGPGADTSYEHGIDAITGILTGPVALPDAITTAPRLITDATARTLRVLLLGTTLPAASGQRPAA